jgi:hypothetical protein
LGATVGLNNIVNLQGVASNAGSHNTIQFAGDAGATGAAVNENAAVASYLTANSLSGSVANNVAGVLAASGGNLSQHAIGEFELAGSTYLVEQAGATGSAYGGNDTIVHLVGMSVTASSSATAGILALHG